MEKRFADNFQNCNDLFTGRAHRTACGAARPTRAGRWVQGVAGMARMAGAQAAWGMGVHEGCRQSSAYGYFYGKQAAPRPSGQAMALGLHCFYIKQAAPRPFEQAHGARLALLLRLQRADRLMVVYLGRCPRLRTVALSARVGHTGRGQAAMGVFRIGHDGCGRCPGLYTGCTASACGLCGHGYRRHG